MNSTPHPAPSPAPRAPQGTPSAARWKKSLQKLASPLLGLLLCFQLSGCAPSFSDSFKDSRAAAQRSYSAGRYREAAQHWERTAAEAPNERQRYEALYRAAVSYKRGRLYQDATRTYQLILSEAPNTSRAPRAAYDLADIRIETGHEAAGFAELERFIARYPSAPNTIHAVKRYLIWLEDEQGSAAAEAWVLQNIKKSRDPKLQEQLNYSYAQLLERTERFEAARKQYLYVADHFPYPAGALWDDALYHASELAERLGDPKAAIGYLERMLKEREPSSMSGSYERPRYSKSQHRIAVLYRDAMGRPLEAANAFRVLRLEYPTSTLRDDAAWQEAILRRQLNDSRGACASLRWLREEIPTSRYAPCAQLVCGELNALDTECRGYIQRELKEQQRVAQ